MVHISNTISGKTPFPYPNTAILQVLDSDQTLVMEEEMVLSPAPFQSASKPAAALGTTITNLSLQESRVDYSIRDRWTAVSARKLQSKKAAETIILIEGQTNQHPILQEKFKHPQSVSKRISLGFQSVIPNWNQSRSRLPPPQRRPIQRIFSQPAIIQYLGTEILMRPHLSP